MSDDTTVVIRRQPSDWKSVAIPLSALSNFHMADRSGGVATRNVGGRPFLYAHVWCDQLPKNEPFGHSCQHGPGPHRILVCLVQKDNDAKVYRELLVSA